MFDACVHKKGGVLALFNYLNGASWALCFACSAD